MIFRGARRVGLLLPGARARRALLLAGVVAVAGLIAASVGLANTSNPTGQVMIGGASFDPSAGVFVGGGATIEPAYDYSTGSLVYLQTPTKARVHPAQKIDPATGLPVNVAPLYLVTYPKGSIDPSALNCAHLPEDNCADHGNAVAGGAEAFAQALDNHLYAGGVAGHDHLVGKASTGGDFNVIWEPILVIFNDPSKVHHITTLTDLQNSNVSELPLPQLDFNCAIVSGAAYDRGTPAPLVPASPQ
jgi:hypothetical protein